MIVTNSNLDEKQPLKLVVRRLRPEDAEAAAVLSEQLGYPVSPAELRIRIERLAGCEDTRSVLRLAWRGAGGLD